MKVKQIIALVVIVALLMAGSVLVTFAYLTSTQTVTNTFTVGKVEITLDEAKVNLKGEPVNAADEVVELEEAPRVAENSYKLIPGHTYTKDPTVTVVTGSEESYIRMMVTIEKYADLCAAYGKTVGQLQLSDLIVGEFGEGWTVENKGAGVFECRYAELCDGSKPIPALFEKIKIPGEIKNAALDTLDGMKIVVVAHAIQADGLGTAEQAWAAFDAEMSDNGNAQPGGE